MEKASKAELLKHLHAEPLFGGSFKTDGFTESLIEEYDSSISEFATPFGEYTVSVVSGCTEITDHFGTVIYRGEIDSYNQQHFERQIRDIIEEYEDEILELEDDFDEDEDW